MLVESTHVKSVWSTGECYRPASKPLLLAHSWHHILMWWRFCFTLLDDHNELLQPPRHPMWSQHLCLQWLYRRSSLAIGSLHQDCSWLTTCLAITPMSSLCLPSCQAIKVRFILCDNCSMLSQASIDKEAFFFKTSEAASCVLRTTLCSMEVKGKLMCLRLQWSFSKCIVQALGRVCIKSGKKEMRQLFTIKAKKVALLQQ